MQSLGPLLGNEHRAAHKWFKIAKWGKSQANKRYKVHHFNLILTKMLRFTWLQQPGKSNSSNSKRMVTSHVVIHSPIMVLLHTQRHIYSMCQRLTDKSVLNTSLDVIIYESSLVKCRLYLLHPMLTSKQKISSLVEVPARKFNLRDFIKRDKWAKSWRAKRSLHCWGREDKFREDTAP